MRTLTIDTKGRSQFTFDLPNKFIIVRKDKILATGQGEMVILRKLIRENHMS